MVWPFADRWDRAPSYEGFVAASTLHGGLWADVFRLARVPEWAVERAAGLRGPRRLVVLAEDWCGDAVNTVPVVAKWAAAVPNVELRLLRRDEHPDVMDRYLTNGVSRSIPVVIVLTGTMEELGWWGPRPGALQAWVMAQRSAGRATADLYPEIRRWYAMDKGAATVREVLDVMERVATPNVIRA